MREDSLLATCRSICPEHAPLIQRLLEISPFFQRLIAIADDRELHELFHMDRLQLPPMETIHAVDEETSMRRLRRFKQACLRQVIWWELALLGDLQPSLAFLTDAAEAILKQAYEDGLALLKPRYGCVDDGAFCVIGLGKLGGRELNLGSDVDLLFLHDGKGVSVGGTRSLPVNEYFRRLALGIVRLVDAPTTEGRAWRVDMRLRPGGDAAPLSISLDACLQHYLHYGQTWERAMLIKSRPIAGETMLGQRFLSEIKPFIWRRYLDYTTVQALAEMKQRIDQKAGDVPPGPGYDVKRGKGGIREIEFYVQAIQLMHGGHHPALMVSGTLPAIERLEALGLLDRDRARRLREGYLFWRRVEHALQARRGEQTHRIPQDGVEYLCRAIGMENLDRRMRETSESVHELFNELFPKVRPPLPEEDWLTQAETLLAAKVHKSETRNAFLASIQRLRSQTTRGGLPERLRGEIAAFLAEAMPEWLVDANGVQALDAFARLVGRIGGRATWIDLLALNPSVRRWLIDVLAASRYVAENVVRDPSWLEWPLERERGEDRIAAIQARLANLDPGCSPEHFLADLGHLVGEGRLTCAMAIIADKTEPLEIGRWLSGIADAAIDAARRFSLSQLDLPLDFPLIAIGMGKLGSREMGLVSDLDLVFILDHPQPGNVMIRGRSMREWAQRVGRRWIQCLTALPPFGAGYQLDARLRPSGQAGVLVTTLDAFRRYQLNEAQVWEHQALCRARFVCGRETSRQAVEKVIQEVLSLPRDEKRLAAEIVAMRRKMLAHLASKEKDILNLKQDAGGLVDIEFLAQYARLVYGGAETGCVATLRTLPRQAAWREDASWLADTYVDYRWMENALRVYLWRSVKRLPTNDAAPEWETLRRHAPIKSVAALRTKMKRVHAIFRAVLGEG